MENQKNNLTQMGAQNCCSKQEEEKHLEIKGGQLTKELSKIEKEKNLNEVKEIKMEENKLGLDTSNQDSNEEINNNIKEIQIPKEKNRNINKITFNIPKKNPNTPENSENYEINIDSEYLFLNCPECQKIPCLSLTNDNFGLILINCDHCRYSSYLFISDYIKGLSNKNLLGKSKCLQHNSFLDKFCIKCHQEYCTKCETKNIHSDHAVTSIRKIYSSEDIKDAKIKIDDYKKEVENYINSFFKENMNKYPTKHDIIKKDLIEPYIEKVKSYFKIAENILLNYDMYYPSYYQILNLKTFLSYINEQISLKRIEIINDYLLKGYHNYYNEKDEKNKKLKDLMGNFKDEKIYTILIYEEKLIIALKQYIKVYNYKNRNCIATIENLYEPGIIFNLTQIFEDLFSVRLYISDNQTILKIFSIKSNNKILFEKSFDHRILNIKTFNDYSIGLLINDSIEIYKSSENFQEISDSLCLKENYRLNLEILGKVEIPRIIDYAYMPTGSYLAALTKKEILIFNQEFKIHKTIKNENIYLFNSLDQLNDGNLILGGYYIGMINKKDLTFSMAHNDGIPKKMWSYDSDITTDMDYSQFNLISSNKIICRKYFKKIYEDIHKESNKEIYVCTFNYNPQTCELKLEKTLPYLDFKELFTTKKGEIIIKKGNNLKFV